MRQGFSLLELSIVLVIIGLLAGGVMTGQSLIRAAELRAVVTEYQRFTTANNAFRDKYQAVPGDFKSATAFWGTNATCPGISTTTASSATCNGNGDGQITPNATTANEAYRYWQQLALAGLVEGTFSGTSADTTAGNAASTVGLNIPASKITNAGWYMGYTGSIPISNVATFEGNYGNTLIFGTFNGTTGTYVTLKPEEMWNIDSKLDDGKPGMGMVVVPESQASCQDATASSTVAVGSTANYLLSTSSIGCWAMFKNVN